MNGALFFSWWRARLGELIPAFLRRRWGSAKAGITLAIDAGRLRISSANSPQPVTVALSPENPVERRPEVEALLGALPGGPQQIRLVLEPHDYLSRRFSLPRAARGNLAEAVGYQLPQLTPFSADQLLYACGETEDSPTGGALSVWLVAVPRDRVERALAVIDQSPPENPLRLPTPPAPGEPLSLTWRASAPSPTAQRSMRLAWVALVALWIGVLGIHLYKQEQQQRMLDETLADLRTKAATVSRLHDRLSTVRTRLGQLSQLKANETSPLTVLDQLSQLLDDDTWLLGLELRRDQLTLRGVSASPASLIETLEATEILEDVSFESAITRDGRSEGDRFNISATLESPQPEAIR
jgi:Tfp pilus assembly protein PilN